MGGTRLMSLVAIIDKRSLAETNVRTEVIVTLEP
jgi:hypothetical protein